MSLIRRMLCAAITTPTAAQWDDLSAADWDALIAVAEAEGVVPLLWRALHDHGWPAAMPAAVRGALHQAWYRAVAQHSLIQRELAWLITTLDPALSVVVLKGVALGTTVYDDPLLRPVSDIDLLVAPDDLLRITNALTALGYEAVPELQAGVDAAVEYHTRLIGGPQRSVAVELHWRLVAGERDWRSPGVDWFWHQREPWPLHPGVDHLTPTAHLLYAAAHLVLQHGSAAPRLIWLYDLHLLLTRRADQIRWPVVIEQARRAQWATALATALDAVSDHWHTPIPAFVFADVRVIAEPHAADLIRQQQQQPPTPLVQEWRKLRALDHPARLRFVAGLIVPSATYIRWRYPRWRWPVGYGYHWIRVIAAAWTLLRYHAPALRRRITP